MSDALEQFRVDYASTFRAYIARAGETGLERAYELGRRAVSDGLSVLDIASVHHACLGEALEGASTPEETERLAHAAADFFMESLSTFEMTQRGFREAQETARLEQEHSAQLRGLADASLAVNSALALEQRLHLITEGAREIIGAHQSAVTVAPGDGGEALDEVSVSPKYAARGDGDAVDDRAGLYELLRGAGKAVRLTEAELRSRAAAAGAGEGDLPLRGWLAAPLIDSAGNELGLIQLSDKYEGDFSENDEAMLIQLAQMAAVAIENARLYEHEHAIAETLQHSLLPPNLPEIPGVEAAARFRPLGEGNEIGGDFYDLFETGSASWAVVIGDVCGKGAAAAGVTALARYTLRATALHETRPSRMLALLNEALLRQAPEDRFCTVTFARLSVVEGAPRLEVASGGHPLPLLIHADGSAEQIGRTGTVLGVMPDPILVDEVVDLREGDNVVFYTDGVTEAQAPQRMIGARELADAIRNCGSRDSSSVARCVEEIALGGRDGVPRDDIAILSLSIGTPADTAAVAAPPTVDVSLSASAGAAAAARRSLEPLAVDLGRGLFECVRLLVNELVTNSLRHAGLEPEDTVELHVDATSGAVRAEVVNPGPPFEPGHPAPHPQTTTGWGLYLVDRLADRWGVDGDGSTRVWFEIDR
jgi:serine phosphatase RsbU (regulator of sigma subunit)/anti-sigma regulatory factor (Ser/Thr protein kinase)